MIYLYCLGFIRHVWFFEAKLDLFSKTSVATLCGSAACVIDGICVVRGSISVSPLLVSSRVLVPNHYPSGRV